VCNAYRSASDTEKALLLVSWNAHKEGEKESMEEKHKDKLAAASNEAYRAITFDLQAVLSTPHAGDSQIYYRRKLAVYNFTILEASSRQGINYVWDETEGGRGANEIGSILLHYLQNLPGTVSHVASFSDTCSGQNRNQYVCSAMLYAVQMLPSIKIIDLKYMESGHSYLEVDSMHSVIEKATKHMKIYTTRDWEVAIGCARKKDPPFMVRRRHHTDVSDMKELASSFITNRTSNVNGETVSWLRIKWLRFCKDKPFVIQYKYSIAAEFMTINVCKRRGRPKVLPNLVRAYRTRLPISAAKKADLLALVKAKIVPTEHALFYKNLPSNAKARDCLPASSLADGDSDEEPE